jgi:hypothetical protein
MKLATLPHAAQGAPNLLSYLQQSESRLHVARFFKENAITKLVKKYLCYCEYFTAMFGTRKKTYDKSAESNLRPHAFQTHFTSNSTLLSMPINPPLISSLVVSQLKCCIYISPTVTGSLDAGTIVLTY